MLPRLGPVARGTLVAVPTILLVVLIATCQTHLSSSWRRELSDSISRDLKEAVTEAASCDCSSPSTSPQKEVVQAAHPFVPPPSPDALREYVECILQPTLIAGTQSHMCEEYKDTKLHSPSVEIIREYPVVLLNHSRCAPLAGFPSDDIRGILYDPAAAYARPITSDGFALVQVLCIEFHFSKLLVPYFPHDRPLAMLDAGANAGYASFLFARLMRFQGTLVSVEMDPASARMVRRNLWQLNAIPGFSSIVVNSALMSTEEEKATPRVEFTTRHDADFMGSRLTTVQAYDGRETKAVVPSVSLPSLVDLAGASAFDFIKLDVEGAEHSILQDPRSRDVLCKARCVFGELHERFKEGIEAAWDEFVASGCPEGHRMRELANTGEYRIVCREDIL